MAGYKGIRLQPPQSRKEPEREPSASLPDEGAAHETQTEVPTDHADTSRNRLFVVVTKDFKGLGWATELDHEGEDVVLAVQPDDTDTPEEVKAHDHVGDGWFDKMPLSEAVNTLQSDNTYWIFDDNSFPEEAEKLRKAGQKVFGTSVLSEKMEHDRKYAMDIAKQVGLDTMSTHEFSSAEEGLEFLDTNPDKAYVFKPDDGPNNYSTFVPIRKEDADANRELYNYLSHMHEDTGSYILQERIKLEDALEVNCELWLYEGEPFLATMGLEVKRKNGYDLGEMSGCSGDFVQIIPLDSPLVNQTVGKFIPFYREQKYTGLADVNVIFTPDNKPHFLEVCNRFGYNCHATVFMGLSKDGFGNIIADILDGKIENFYERFREDQIGASLTLFLDHPRPGLPVHIGREYSHQYFPYDGYREDGMDDETILLAGYSTEVGIFVDHASTVEAAAHKVADLIAFEEAISFPDMLYRWDLWEDNFYNAPVLRYKELKKRGLLK